MMRLERRAPDPRLAGVVGRYADFAQRTDAPCETGEVPGRGIVVIVDLDAGWTVEGGRFGSFVGGIYARPVRVRHEGSSRAVQFDLEPPAVRRLFGVPAGALAEQTVDLDVLLGADAARLADRLHGAADSAERFAILDETLLRLAARAAPARPDVERAWTLLRASRGTLRVDALADALGCSRRHLAARFVEDVGAGPKLAARLIRLESVRNRLGTASLGRLAVEHGFADQAHLVS
ncbi:MAG: helix-turn-helix domain-containing protein [Solirubrobacteraceae bacterium]